MRQAANVHIAASQEGISDMAATRIEGEVRGRVPVSSPIRNVIRRGASASNRLLPLVLLAMLWEIAARAGTLNAFLFPPPTAVAHAIENLVSGGADPPYALLRDIGGSVVRLVVGVGIATVTGTFVGFSMGITNLGYKLFYPIVSVLMPIPSLAWIPVFLVIFGVGNTTMVAIVALAASFPMLWNTMVGVRSVSRQQRWAVEMMGGSRIDVVRRVLIPGAMPYAITGLRLATGLAWQALVASEMIAATTSGLGFMIFRAREYLAIPDIYAGVLTIAILGILIERVVFGSIERCTVRRWGMVSDL